MKTSKDSIKIVAEKNKLNGKDGYRWAWKESADKKVYGIATSIDEITRRAKRMFPDMDIELSVS